MLVQKFKTNRIGLTLLGLSLYSLGAYVTLMEKGVTSLPALIFFAFFWCFMLASGWNDIYIYEDKVAFKNYFRFWRKDTVIYFQDIASFAITDGSLRYYELVIYLKNGKTKSFAVYNQIDPEDLIWELEEQALPQRKY